MRYGRTETTTREFDEVGKLVSETVTTVEERRVIEKPPGFQPAAEAEPIALIKLNPKVTR